MIRGFWYLLWKYRREALLNAALPLAFIAAGLTYRYFPIGETDRLDVALATVAGVASALLGLVLAGLAIMVGLMNEDYMSVAHRAGRGVIEDFFPFSFTGTVAGLTVLFSTASLVFLPRECEEVVRWVAAGNAFLLVWTLVGSLDLLRFSADIGVTRAELVVPRETKPPEADSQDHRG